MIFTMYDYINEILESLPEITKGTLSTPVSNNLFKVNNTTTEKLDKTTPADLFQHYTAQPYFLSKCT